MQIQYTDKTARDHGQKALVYGKSGIGKTASLASAPTPLIFSAEKGLLSLKRVKVPFIDISDYKKLVEAYQWATGSAEAKQYESFGLDSISEIAEVVLSEEQKKTKDPRKAYGEMQTQIVDLIRNFRDIPGKNVIFIAKELQTEMRNDLDEPFPYTSPSLPSKTLANNVAYFFDLVLYMFMKRDAKTKENVRYFRTEQTTSVLAKDRSGELEPIVEPNFEDIFALCAK